MNVEDRPLATFGVVSYNQKAYLIEALKGAVSQTYRPLEIVISDDGSTDGSWDYIQEWKNNLESKLPDVKVVISQNRPNLGRFANWQRVVELASGEIIIKADGDDVSLPERTSKVVEAWVRDGKRAVAVFNAGYQVDPSGHIIGEISAPSLEEPTGALSSWTKSCYTLFGNEIRYPRIVDDVPYLWRAKTIGDGLQILDKLVYYRVGTGISTSIFRIRPGMVRSAQCGIDAYEQVFIDLEFSRRRIGDARVESLLLQARQKRALYVAYRDMCGGATFRQRNAAYRQIARQDNCPFFSILNIQRLLFQLPSCLCDALLGVYSILNYVRKRLKRAR